MAKGGGFWSRLRDNLRESLPGSREGYWKPKAIALINDINFPLFYGPEQTPEKVLALGEEYGYGKLVKALREKMYTQDLYWEDDKDGATNRWLHRDQNLPDWFWWYHGFNA
jgi:hypothetical protein